MTNEELAVLAHAGDGEALMELWSQVQRLVRKQAARWAAACRSGVTEEDLVQAGFIAVLSAIDSYDPSKAKFSTWLYKRLQGEFTAACGQQSERARLDALQTAVSLDAPLTDDNSDPLTLADTIEDPAAEAEIENAGVRLAVAAMLGELPEDQRRAIMDRYWYDLPTDSKAHAAALRCLRHPSRSKQLRAYL